MRIFVESDFCHFDMLLTIYFFFCFTQKMDTCIKSEPHTNIIVGQSIIEEG